MSSQTQTPVGEPVRIPVARIKRIIKQDPDIMAVNNTAVFNVAGAVQLFVGHVAEQALLNARANGRARLTYNDFARAIANNEELGFLRELVPETVPFQQVKEAREGAGLEEEEGELVDPQPEQMEPEYEEEAPEESYVEGSQSPN